MGKSPSIDDLAKKQQAFNDYLTSLESQLEQKATAANQQLQALIGNTYSTNGWTHQIYITGKKTDFMQQSDWSMANVKKIIDAIGDAMFGDSSQMPDGINLAQETQEMGAAIEGMENMELYITSKVFDVLSGIVESFGSSSSVTYNSELKTEPLGNGFRLFASVSADSFKSTSFFNNDAINEYLYVFEVHFSEDEAKQQAQITVTKLYEDQIQTFSDKIEQLLTDLENNKIDAQQYETQQAIYQQLIDAATAKLNQLKTAGQKLLVAM